MEFSVPSLISAFILVLCLVRISHQADDVLYPYGEDAGDMLLPGNDDEDSGSINLELEFPFFDQNQAKLIVNTNGIISFGRNVSQYTPDSFPLDDDRRIVAPFWADVDTSPNRGTGKVWYRQTTEDSDLLRNLTEQITSIFRVEFRFRSFEAKFAFIATWENVTFYTIRHTVPPVPSNTFQAVLVSDGTYSFTIFNYHKIEWTTGSSSFGDKNTGLAGNSSNAVAAQVGFNAGDGINYYSVPGSQTDQILTISQTSNVFIPGRWVFRIDGRFIEAAGCSDDRNTKLQISPQQVSMLGGEVLSISGPCFQRGRDVRCRIEGVVVQAVYDVEKDPFTVRCATPVLMRVGPLDVELSKDGGRNYNYTGKISIVGLDQIEPAITIKKMTDIYRVSWNVVGFPYPDSRAQDIFIDMLLYLYDEDVNTDTVSLVSASRLIESNVRLANGVILISIEDVMAETNGADVGVFRITEAGKVNMSIEIRWVNGQPSTNIEAPLPAMWSLPFNLNPESNTAASEWCREWRSTQTPIKTTGDNIPPCPCLLSQAEADVSVFEAYPWCDRGGDEECEYRRDATHCVRARVASNLGRGQLCCYSADGNLMYFADFPTGGYVEEKHHRGFRPNRLPGNIPYLSNYLWDRIPWEECCGKTIVTEMDEQDITEEGMTPKHSASCDLFREIRPSDDCKYYQAPTVATVFGEPHLITFDTRGYTFNGYGEYILIKTTPTAPKDLDIVVQARMEQIIPHVYATGLTAVAIKGGTSSTVQVELNERRTMDAWIRAVESGSDWNAIDFERSNFWLDNGLTIELATTDDGRKSFAVTFDQGIAIELEEPPNSTAMAVRVYLPPPLKGHVVGLLGTWNDEPLDDFTAPSGRIISGSSPENLHAFFGAEWNVSKTSTLFRYDIGSNYSTINNDDFEPVYDLTNFLTEEELSVVCGDDEFCRYDYKKTGDAESGAAAAHAHNSWQNKRERTRDVVSCGYLPPLENGEKTGVVYLIDSVVNMRCLEGYMLDGTREWLCGEDGEWVANKTTKCVELGDGNQFLILYIVMAILAFLILLSCLLIVFICVIKRRRKDKKGQARSKSNAGLSVAYQNGGYNPDELNISKSVTDGAIITTSTGTQNGHTEPHWIDRELGPPSEGVANGHAANGTAASNDIIENGHMTNGRLANGHAATPNGAVGVANGVASVSGGEEPSGRHAQPSTSQGDQPSTSDGSFHYAGKAPPIEKKLKKKAKENPYDVLPASLKAKLNNPDYETLSRYRKDLPILMDDHNSDESEDEIANIKAQIKRELRRRDEEGH